MLNGVKINDVQTGAVRDFQITQIVTDIKVTGFLGHGTFMSHTGYEWKKSTYSKCFSLTFSFQIQMSHVNFRSVLILIISYSIRNLWDIPQR